MKLNQILKVNAVAIAAVIFSGAVMSFKVAEKKAATTYFYNNSSIASGAFSNPSHWQTTNLSGCEDEGERPCSIVVPDGQTLNDVLDGKSNAQVLSMSSGRKP
ncbi:hypothetical protein [Chryseobacterium geocarposphaerae]|uniref:Uncharacterized protein n=1 Tax=Chryseobacterium geocarposphaerae TaxID=1416776 RepID=A0A2M9C909_9FLAO|nr:hypothetical protein [Chryseobacterium geocarposphaerae]PJJ67331.1 hypothetical protein CLV73_1337 [Chryseobacterium geocarposphaerae]